MWRLIYTYNAPGTPQIGTLNALLEALVPSFVPRAWLVDPHYNNYALIFVGIWMGTGLATLILSAAIKGIPRDLVESASRCYARLANSQRQVRLLHGDLHHGNVLSDSRRGWLAIDPKGVVGEIEFEIGAVLRNPVERPDLFVSEETIENRCGVLVRRLNLDRERLLQWAFAQAVLSAIWSVEDGSVVDMKSPALSLATIIGRILA